MGEAAISIQGVSKVFGQETVLKEVTHDFQAGRIHGIVGLNGSGKTVLLKCICGFMQPTEGKILVEGKQIGKDIDFPDSLGMIIENPGFLPGLTGFDNLKLLASIRKRISNKEIKRSMELVGLDPDLKKSVKNYSLGMRERLGIAQAIMENPHILILDEPFNGLDKKGVQDIYNLINSLKSEDRTMLLVSHNTENIEVLCDTVCEMELGRLREIKS